MCQCSSQNVILAVSVPPRKAFAGTVKAPHPEMLPHNACPTDSVPPPCGCEAAFEFLHLYDD